jgi:hypothetical protein
MVELDTGALGDGANVRGFVISRNNGSGVGAIERTAWLRGRTFHRQGATLRPGSSSPAETAGGRTTGWKSAA